MTCWTLGHYVELCVVAPVTTTVTTTVVSSRPADVSCHQCFGSTDSTGHYLVHHVTFRGLIGKNHSSKPSAADGANLHACSPLSPENTCTNRIFRFRPTNSFASCVTVPSSQRKPLKYFLATRNKLFTLSQIIEGFQLEIRISEELGPDQPRQENRNSLTDELLAAASLTRNLESRTPAAGERDAAESRS